MGHACSNNVNHNYYSVKMIYVYTDRYTKDLGTYTTVLARGCFEFYVCISTSCDVF